MRINVKIKAIFIIIYILGLIFVTSDTSLCNITEADSKVEKQYLYGDDYEKYSGEKILLSNQHSNISGLFGNLKLTSIIIQPTTDFIINQIDHKGLYDTFRSSKQWVFKNATLEEIQLLFRSAGLDNGKCNQLLLNTSVASNGKEYITTPGDSFFWNLAPEIRAKLYPMIGNYSDNPMYSQPLYFESDTAEEWFYNSGLTNEVKDKLISLTYVANGISYISDVHLILPYLSESERIKFLKIAYRTKSMDIMLQINEGQNVSDIAKYWGSLGRISNIESILDELSNKPGGGEINIDELLPSIPQKRVNTYCGAYEYETDYKDCHWTTINFFNNSADERYYDLPDLTIFINEISKPLKRDSQLKFGDIICIFDKNNELIHSCIYIADNLTYTKNGMGNLNPFVISYLDKTISIYGEKSVYLSRTIANTLSAKL
ncbi:MAG: hypothetical protein Q8942_18920 [Bacillota bacterium]|nr:hypothetical protein [Bacillota bacterium]